MLAAAGVARPARAASGQTIVIGAGIAGLAAAQALVAGGQRVVVLESRDRIGGRLWTSNRWSGLPVDLGASWIHGVKRNPITALADAAGAQRLQTRYDRSLTLDATGRSLDLDAVTERAEAMIEAARADIEDDDQDVSLRQAVEQSPGWRKADPAERRLFRHIINATCEQEYGGDWGALSAWNFDAAKEFGGGDVLFPDGYGQIAAHLARGLDIRLNEPVTRIDPGARVVTALGSHAADQVVVTLPLGVLQAAPALFGDSLAPARQAALTALRMGLLNKCWLRFDRVQWPDDVDWIEWLGPQDGVWAEWLSLARHRPLPVLLGFNAGAQARALEQLDDAATVASAHQALRAMFGTRFPAPLQAQITRWGQDRHSLGSYSFQAVGTSPQTRRDLAGADWDGALVFAGEACSPDHSSTVHGAYASGVAAAKLILG